MEDGSGLMEAMHACVYVYIGLVEKEKKNDAAALHGVLWSVDFSLYYLL